jgi:hypothetical protein
MRILILSCVLFALTSAQTGKLLGKRRELATGCQEADTYSGYYKNPAFDDLELKVTPPDSNVIEYRMGSTGPACRELCDDDYSCLGFYEESMGCGIFFKDPTDTTQITTDTWNGAKTYTKACLTSVYELGTKETNECAIGSEGLEDADECETAANELGLVFSGDEEMDNSPSGCYFMDTTPAGMIRAVYWNDATPGKQHAQSTPICKSSAADGATVMASSHGDPIIHTFKNECYDLNKDGLYLASSHPLWNHNVHVGVYNEFIREIQITDDHNSLLLSISNLNEIYGDWAYGLKYKNRMCRKFSWKECEFYHPHHEFDAQVFKYTVQVLHHDYLDPALKSGERGIHLDIYPEVYQSRMEAFAPEEYEGIYFDNPLPEELHHCPTNSRRWQ